MKSALVVGAGLAGLSAALELAKAGARVDVFERASEPGGRAARLISPDGRFRFDAGPTLIVMTDVLRRALGEDAFAALDLRRLEPGYSVRWRGGERFDMHSDVALWLLNVARFEGPNSAARSLAYLAHVYEQYLESRARILDVDFRWSTLPRHLLDARKLRPWALGNLRGFTSRYFESSRVREALTFQSLYLGLSPSRSPAVYSLLPVVEVVGGIWYASGGTAAIVDAFVRECERNGVRLHFGKRVDRVILRGRRAVGISAEGALHTADAVVVAADREPALGSLFGEKPATRLRYGHSAFVAYLGVKGSVDLPHHTVVLPDDPWAAYRQLDAGEIPRDPPLYVCNASRSDTGVAPPGFSALMMLVPVPNRAVLPDFSEEAVYRRALAVLEEHAGPIAHRIAFRRLRGPAGFERELGLKFGAAFGPDHALSQMGPLRPPIGYRKASNVAFAGSGTRPGSGVPLVIASGRLAAEHVMMVMP